MRIARYDLCSYDLPAFKEAFRDIDPENPMLDCYPINESQKEFLKGYLKVEPERDFNQKSYFVEAHYV